MAHKNVRVDLPIGSPKNTIELTDKIIEKHTAMGAGSPLTGNPDMGDFATKATAAKTAQKNGDMAEAKAQATYLHLAKVCGIAKGQNRQSEGTVYWYILHIRDFLLLHFKGLEETLTEFGFNVVISQSASRRYVRVDIPKSTPALMLELADDIVEQHTTLAAASPLLDPQAKIADFITLAGDANVLLAEYNTADAEAQAFHNEALYHFGYGAGQTSLTEGTVYYMLCLIRDRLLLVYNGLEETLSLWGFEVVITLSKTKKKDSTLVATRQGTLAPQAIHYVNMEGEDIQPTYHVTLGATDSIMRFYASETPDGAPALNLHI